MWSDSGGLVFNSHRLLYHSAVGSIVIKKKKKKYSGLNSELLNATQAASVAGSSGEEMLSKLEDDVQMSRL